MAVLIEAICVIVRDSALDKKEGLRELFLENIPSQAYCYDGYIHRIGFMNNQYMWQYVDFLRGRLGLIYTTENEISVDIAIVDMQHGVNEDSDWLRFNSDTFFKHRTEYKKCDEKFSIAWAIECPDGDIRKYTVFGPTDEPYDNKFEHKGICFPHGWTPDRAIYLSDLMNPDDYEEVSRTDQVITMRNKKTGEIKYIGIPDKV